MYHQQPHQQQILFQMVPQLQQPINSQQVPFFVEPILTSTPQVSTTSRGRPLRSTKKN
jgi:hypothetical protein